MLTQLRLSKKKKSQLKHSQIYMVLIIVRIDSISDVLSTKHLSKKYKKAVNSFLLVVKIIGREAIFQQVSLPTVARHSEGGERPSLFPLFFDVT